MNKSPLLFSSSKVLLAFATKHKSTNPMFKANDSPSLVCVRIPIGEVCIPNDYRIALRVDMQGAPSYRSVLP